MQDQILVIPCYNEESRFKAQDFQDALKHQPGLHLLFVNDGSRDGTEAVLEAFVQRFPDRSELLTLPENQGKAEAVRQGVLKSFARRKRDLRADDQAGFVGYWDADLATPFQELPRFLEVFSGRPELSLVMGARVNLLGRSIERKALRHYLGRVFATAASMLLRLAVYDTQCGAKLFRMSEETEKLFEKPFITAWAFDVELLARLTSQLKGRRPGSVIYELPLLQWKDIAGSKLRARDFAKITYSLFRIARHYPRPKPF